MSNWLEKTIAEAQDVSDWLSPKREVSLAKLKGLAWPGRKTEDWKYTSLYPLESSDLKTAANDALLDVAASSLKDSDTIDLVFVNGRLVDVPKDLPSGLSIVSFDCASEEDKLKVLESFSTVKPEKHFFGLVNDALAANGLLIAVEDNAQVAPLIRCVYLNSTGESHARALLLQGQGSSVRLLEEFHGDVASFNTVFLESVIGENAKLEHYRFAMQIKEAMSVGGCHFKLHEKAELNSTVVGFGSTLARLDIDVEHAGEQAFAKLNAIYLLDKGENFDLHTTIEHAVPNGTTEENIRGIVAEQAKAVFNGRIHIHRHAQKTLAELNNRNLLLSRSAEVYTKPELEIYADDVRCAHGATVAETDKKALYYLQSRGVDKADAQVMLNFGFINELVDEIPDEAVAEWLREALRERFSQMNNTAA